MPGLTKSKKYEPWSLVCFDYFDAGIDVAQHRAGACDDTAARIGNGPTHAASQFLGNER